MRIISGIHKGRRLTAPKNLPVRPTTDLAKESLFNILNNNYHFDEITVLDLFSGTGNISYEFASRGVPGVLAVDAHYACIQFIQKTAEMLSLPITPVKSDVYKFLEGSGKSFDVIFADPPYDLPQDQFEAIIQLIFKNSWVEPNGMLIIEHSKHMDLSSQPNFSQARKYGGSVFSFFQQNT
ncbi:16S rRNA (guanine(966)-N(2))-methyltransferase RsmD [Altibacter sp.]|uniref:16S rRNA (guanine(966)-N(2))-methyltransferase RsmD n=1 Tax=Altibacter sp. TaxID=2024823 RepID=UPI000C8EB96F|nr:16S rRNA (guanine(966)-N(2))-methyltransferase RsmD [Altibacter sp.]MAP55967.1 16S rRNA (guanine(966)-N(2))-methyltransferase RsmD [Altibacter sp.]